jgi:hypothetical protein
MKNKWSNKIKKTFSLNGFSESRSAAADGGCPKTKHENVSVHWKKDSDTDKQNNKR